MSSSVQAREVETFDPLEPSHIQNPFGFFSRLRTQQPVYWNEQYSFWMLSRYRDVKTALQAPQKYSSVTRVAIERWRDKFPQSARADFDTGLRFFYGHLQASDPPEHTMQKQVLMKAFMSLVTGVVKTSLEHRVSQLLDKMECAGTFDFVKEFAYPLPSAVIFDMLGIPDEHRQLIRETSEMIVRFPGAVYTANADLVQRIAEKATQAQAVLLQLVAGRRRHPEEDLISSLVRPGGGIDQMSDEDIVILSIFLLTAGHETTANLLGGSLRYLLQSRRQWERLIASPELLPGAVEELFRFVSPVLWVARVLTEDVQLEDRVLRKGNQVILGVGSANHDPREFEDPETLDITRKNVHALSLGYGIHTCLGAALARMETQVALSALLQRMPGIQLKTTAFEYQPVYFLRALKSLPVAVNE